MRLITKGFLLYICTTPVFAMLVYGTENLERFQIEMPQPLYIQMGSFSKQSAAIQLQQDIKTHTSAPVHLQTNDEKYQVIVGPFYNYSNLKSFSKGWVLEKEKIFGSHHWFVNGQIGGQKSLLSSSGYVNNGSDLPSPYSQDLYSSQSPDLGLLLGIQFGHRWELTHEWVRALSVGALYQYFSSNELNGQISQFTLSQFKNYNYQWKVDNQLFLANIKLNVLTYNQWSPYFHVGLGGVLHQTSGYREIALSGVTPRISPQYQNHSNTEFAYILGAGIDYQFSPQWIANIGYQYSNLGQISSGSGMGSWSTQSLNFGSYQSNAFIFGLSYLFDMDIQ